MCLSPRRAKSKLTVKQKARRGDRASPLASARLLAMRRSLASPHCCTASTRPARPPGNREDDNVQARRRFSTSDNPRRAATCRVAVIYPLFQPLRLDCLSCLPSNFRNPQSSWLERPQLITYRFANRANPARGRHDGGVDQTRSLSRPCGCRQCCHVRHQVGHLCSEPSGATGVCKSWREHHESEAETRDERTARRVDRNHRTSILATP